MNEIVAAAAAGSARGASLGEGPRVVGAEVTNITQGEEVRGGSGTDLGSTSHAEVDVGKGGAAVGAGEGSCGDGPAVATGGFCVDKGADVLVGVVVKTGSVGGGTAVICFEYPSIRIMEALVLNRTWSGAICD
jgi:hypothetical protein